MLWLSRTIPLVGREFGEAQNMATWKEHRLKRPDRPEHLSAIVKGPNQNGTTASQ